MDAFWVSLLGISGTLAGGILGHILGRSEAARAWNRSLELHKLEWKREDDRRQEQREHARKLEFEVDVRFVGLQHEEWIVELVAAINNKGLVQHRITKFTFDLRCLMVDDPVTEGGEEINGQVFIPNAVKGGSWLPEYFGGTFVEPGLTATYRHITQLSASASFALLHGQFQYSDGRDDYEHTADKFVKVPERH